MGEKTPQQKASQMAELIVAAVIALRSERPVGKFAAGVQCGMQAACSIAEAHGFDLEPVYRGDAEKAVSPAAISRGFALLALLFRKIGEMKRITSALDGPGLTTETIDKLIKELECLTGAN